MVSTSDQHPDTGDAGAQAEWQRVWLAAAAAAAAMTRLETARQAEPLDPTVSAWPQVRWEPGEPLELAHMWCFWCDAPMLWRPGECAWHVTNPAEVFGDPDAALTYLHEQCVPALYNRQRLDRARHTLRQRHTRYQRATTAAYGVDGRVEPRPGQHAEIDDLARAVADSVGELLDLLDAEPRL